MKQSDVPTHSAAGQQDRIRIKICGITNLKDALLALEAGADYLGLIFVARSPRHVSLEKAREIAQALKGHIPLVGVFQNPSLDDIQSVLETIPLDLIQLHGEETPDFVARMPLPVIRFIPLAAPETLLAWAADLKQVSTERPNQQINTPIYAYLMEPPKGSGLQTDAWLQRHAADSHPTRLQALQIVSRQVPLFLAGGLTPDNIGPLLEQIRPYAVDVASGVEAAPGVKDADALQRFCQTVQRFQTPPTGDSSACNPLDFSALMAAYMSQNP